MANTLDGKVAIVTGAARGIGRAITLGLLGAGARITVSDIDADVLNEVRDRAKEMGASDRLHLLPLDVGKDESAAKLVKGTIEHFGRLDILVNNAGTSVDLLRNDPKDLGPKFWRVTPAEFRRVIEVNAVAPFLLAREAAGPMMAQKSGRIINVTTSLDTMYRAGLLPYGSSKAANEANVVVMAEELKGTGITVNALTPGGPANTRLVPEGNGLPREKLLRPEIVVPPILWLATDESGDFTGQRFVAAKWDTTVSGLEAAKKCAVPAAWQQLGNQAIYPTKQA